MRTECVVVKFLKSYPDAAWLLKDLNEAERRGIKPAPQWAYQRMHQFLLRRMHTMRVVAKKPPHDYKAEVLAFNTLPPAA